jgi:hypothetical protein
MGLFDEKTRGWKSCPFKKNLVHLIVDLAVSMRPRKRLPQSLSELRSCFCGLYQTAEAASAVSIRPRKISQKFSCRLLRSLSGRWSRFCSLYQTAEAIHFQQLSWFSRRIRSYIQNGFSPRIRALGGIVWWKNRGSKISWHCPFKTFLLPYPFFPLFIFYSYLYYFILFYVFLSRVLLWIVLQWQLYLFFLTFS